MVVTGVALLGRSQLKSTLKRRCKKLWFTPSLQLTASLPLKIDGCSRCHFFLLGNFGLFSGLLQCSNFAKRTTDFGTVVLTDLKRSRYNKLFFVKSKNTFFSGNGPQISGNYTVSKLVRKVYFVFELENFCLLPVWNPPFTNRIIEDFWPIQPVIHEAGNLNTGTTIQRLQPTESQ